MLIVENFSKCRENGIDRLRNGQLQRSQCMQWPEENIFFEAFSIFESGGITKHLMTGPSGNSEFCSPRPQH